MIYYRECGAHKVEVLAEKDEGLQFAPTWLFFWKSCSFMDLSSLKSWVVAQVPIFPRNLKAGREWIKKNSRKWWGQQHSLSSLPTDNWVTLPPLLSYWCTFFWYLDSRAFVKRKAKKSFLNRRVGFLDLLTRWKEHCHWRFLYRYPCILAETHCVCQNKVLLTCSMVWSLSCCHVQFWKSSASQEKHTCGCRVVLICFLSLQYHWCLPSPFPHSLYWVFGWS